MITTQVAGGLRFDTVVAGPVDGDPVIALHGFPETSASWSPVIPGLVEAGLRVHAPDQRGYSPGARPAGVADYATDTLAGDVLALADAWGLDSFHLVGHDWGASVAWVVAAHHPDRVRSLTTVSVPHLAAYGAAVRDDPEQRAAAAYFGLFRQEGVAEETLLAHDAAYLRDMWGADVPADLVDTYLARLREPGALRGALHWYRAMTSDLGALPDVTVPTTFVWGDRDVFITRAGAVACAAHVTGDYRYVEVTGGSHWLPEQRPDVLVEEILRRVRSTP